MKPRTIETIQKEQEERTLKLLEVQERGAAEEELLSAPWAKPEPTDESTERLRNLLLRCNKTE